MQPFYLFLRKHFHQIYRADLYIFMDTTQFVRRGYHNRNRIKTKNGYLMLTVPTINFGSHSQVIKDVKIDNRQKWQKKHWMSIVHNYAKAPFFNVYSEFFEDVYSRDWEYLADLNIYLIKKISTFLGIRGTAFKRLSELGIKNDNPTQQLIDICVTVGATNYIIGTRAKDYMEEWRWEKTKVKLEYFEPEYPPYPQLWGDFLENCSIIDLLFNCGPESGEYIWGDKFKHFNKMKI